jgi:hypothetical protein
MWRSAALVAVSVALVAAAVAAADPLDPKTKIVAADQARAVATLLRRADLGAGWAGGQITPVSLKAPRCPALQPSFRDLTLTGHAEASFHLDSAGWQVDSDVTLLRSAKQVAAQFKRLLQPKLATCVRYDVLKSTGTDPNVKLGFSKRLAFPKVGDVAARYRTTIAYKLGKQTVAVYDDVLMLAKGRTELWLNFVAPSSDEATLELREQEIARTLLKRVRA